MEDVYTKVSAKTQLRDNRFAVFFGEGEALRVAFLGNSITRHEEKADIGWHRNWGMAASAMEKDYVHLLAAKIDKIKPAAYCISQAAIWECEYKNGSKLMPEFDAAREFGADILIVKLGANCPRDAFDETVFKKEFETLLAYHNPRGNAKIIVAGDFYHHPANAAAEAFAAENGHPFVMLEDLSDDAQMRAYGLFEHGGVAGHPGDRGMEAIAERIWDKLLPLL